MKYKEHISYPEEREPEPSEREWRKDIEKEFAAFANASGGIILFGMTNDGEISPFPKPEHEIQRTIVQFIKDSTPVPEVEISDPIELLHKSTERILLGVKVEEASRKPVSTSDSAYYVRINDEKQPMSRELLESMFIEGDRRQQAIRQLEVEISRLQSSYQEQIEHLPETENVPPLEAIDENAIRNALQQNTHLFSKEETEVIAVGILVELDRVSTSKRLFREDTRNISRVSYQDYGDLNENIQKNLKQHARRLLELFDQLEEKTQLMPPENT